MHHHNTYITKLRYVSDNEWMCKTCDRALKRGVMPLQAKANGLQLSEIPPELSDALELSCLHVPFIFPCLV